jgi:N-sulfoglucosamine sulfohydrolase
MNKLIILTLFVILINLHIYSQDIRPNVLIFIADDVSWDDLGCYGNKQVQTSNIDKLAAEGILFTNVYLTASSSSPSRNSIMTGRYPHNTGAAELHTEPPVQMISFPELLRKSNYYTVLSGKFHLGQYARRGFDLIHDNLNITGDGGEEMWVRAIHERPGNKPFFMWFASYDAHRDWGPNEFSGTHDPELIDPPFYLADGNETRTDLARYYDEIKRFDYYIGEVVNELQTQNVLDNTLIIIMADNGRPFPHSKTRVNDRGMKTPFIVHWPEKIKQPAICNSLVSSIDIASTILTLANIPIPGQFQGYSFDRLFIKPESEFRNFVFAEHNWHDYEAHERMVRNKDFMYILNSRPLAPQMGPADVIGSPSFDELLLLKNSGKLSTAQADVFIVPRPEEELYDYNRDPLQLLNVASVPEYKGTLYELRKILKEWMQETGDDIPADLTKDWFLREPGYIETANYNIRKVMPGSRLNAAQNNNKGRF